jgi:hypothetical protein
MLHGEGGDGAEEGGEAFRSEHRHGFFHSWQSFQ